MAKKPIVQGGVDNYLGKQPQVVAPRKWQSSPDAPPTELAYITKAEKDLILKKNWEELTESFLQNHYDPSYSSNTIKNDRKIIKLINAKSLSHSEISKIAKKILKNN